MISEVTITLDGDEIGSFLPIGASIHYGINQIPCAMVQLDPSSSDLLCDFDAIRGTNATLNVETTNGCLYFDGFVDGLSFSQSPGGLSANLVLKHPYQRLMSIYPRIVGVHPGSSDIFRPLNLLNVNFGAGANEDQVMRTLSVYNTNLNFNQNLVDFSVDLMRAAVEVQKLIPITDFNSNTVGLHRVIKDSEIFRKQLIDQTIELLNKIDTTATEGMIISAASKGMVDMTIQNISMMRDNVFNNLVRLLSELGCCLVIGSRNAYVVPEAGYVRIPKLGAPGRQQRSNLVNIIYPAEYNSFTFNDNGLVNLKGVYVMHDHNTSISGLTIGNHIDLGVYIDDAAPTGNIYATTMPQFVSYGIVHAAILGGGGMQNKIKKKQPLAVNRAERTTVREAINNSYNNILKDETRKTFMNQWAQLEYCRMKYDDRVGSISSVFNNNWAPGAAGTLYTREPGTWVDYFVTDVTHSFQMNPPNSGSAMTSVQFKSGRMGATAEVGLDSIELYKYGYKEAQAFGNKFLLDIAT